MTCVNFTNYVENINTICGQSVPVIMDDCEAFCMLNIVRLLNDCLGFLVVLNLNEELEDIVEFCYNKNYVGH